MPSPVRLQFEEQLRCRLRGFRGRILNVGGGGQPYRDWVPGEMVNVDAVGAEQVDIVCNFGDGLPIQDESFDYCICTSVLEHVRRPKALLNDIERVLRRDGVLLIYVPYLVPVHPDPQDFWRFSPDGLDDLLVSFRELDRAFIGGPGTLVANILRNQSGPRLPHRLRRSSERWLNTLGKTLDARISSAERWASGYFRVVAKKR